MDADVGAKIDAGYDQVDGFCAKFEDTEFDAVDGRSLDAIAGKFAGNVDFVAGDRA